MAVGTDKTAQTTRPFGRQDSRLGRQHSTGEALGSCKGEPIRSTDGGAEGGGAGGGAGGRVLPPGVVELGARQPRPLLLTTPPP